MLMQNTPNVPIRARWISASEYVTYLIAQKKNCALLHGEQIQQTLFFLSEQEGLLTSQLLQYLEGMMQVNEIPFHEGQVDSVVRLSQVAFLVKGNSILPSEYFRGLESNSIASDEIRMYFLSAALPKQKLSKKQFVNTLMDRRWSIIGLALALGTPPIIGGALAELLQQPLFDNFVPEGQIPAIVLVGFASIALQLTGQIIGTMQTLTQSYFTQNLDLETKVSTAQRYLLAKASALPQKDIGSWRLTFSVSSAFLGSINSLFISIPLAVISMAANILVIGAFTDLSAVWNLFLILLIPTALSIGITYLSSNISIRVIGQQSAIQSTIYEAVRQIRGIWLSNTEAIFIDRFARARVAISESLLRAGRLDAVSSVLNNLFQGFLYAFIFYEYYKSYLDPARSNLSVGSLLVIYFAIGSLSGSLSSIADDLVSIAQSLPTYWMPNAIRDINVFRNAPSPQPIPCPASVAFSEVIYTAVDADYPFSQPVSLTLRADRSYALVGPSGSGKSTLIGLLTSHLSPKSGSIQLFDENQQRLDHSLIDCRLLVLSQETNLYGSRLSDVVDPSKNIPYERLEEACAQLDLTHLLDSLPLRWQTPINEFSRDLSLGQLQRFKIARALVADYDIIISDEATCHLPEDQHLEMMQLLNQRSKIHLSVLHRTSALHLFDEVIEIDRQGYISMNPVPVS
ncbi:ATP-binding cassette domain-containing protein [Synechococcus sp. A10-1-5-9]|uniref:ATP-binding cassette domain-containing protein n=1 Tax=Synechococcus sp. A10-1-5-9 TaxID=3392295 RepID=UPI0039EC8600